MANEFVQLHKALGEYKTSTYAGIMARAQASGKGVLSAEGNVLLRPAEIQEAEVAQETVVNTPQAQTQAQSGKDNDTNKLFNAMAIAGTAPLAPAMNHSNIGGNSGFLGPQKPYVTIIQQPPIGTQDFNSYVGLPLEAKRSLSTLTGYTEVSQVFFPPPKTGIRTMTMAEENEIRELLFSGVII